MMMMKSVIWWRKPEYPEETTDLRQVTDETFHTYGLCPVQGLNLGRSGVKQSELRRDESDALAHRVRRRSLHKTKLMTRYLKKAMKQVTSQQEKKLNLRIFGCYYLKTGKNLKKGTRN